MNKAKNVLELFSFVAVAFVIAVLLLGIVAAVIPIIIVMVIVFCIIGLLKRSKTKVRADKDTNKEYIDTEFKVKS